MRNRGRIYNSLKSSMHRKFTQFESESKSLSYRVRIENSLKFEIHLKLSLIRKFARIEDQSKIHSNRFSIEDLLKIEFESNIDVKLNEIKSESKMHSKASLN